MEIADLFVINKADRPGAERLAREVDMMLHFRLGQAMKHVPAHHGVDLKRVAATAGAPALPTARRRESKSRGRTRARTRRGRHRRRWAIPVLQTIAETGQGVPELRDALGTAPRVADRSGELSTRRRNAPRRARARRRPRRLMEAVWRERDGERMLRGGLAELESGTATPYTIAARIVRAALG